MASARNGGTVVDMDAFVGFGAPSQGERDEEEGAEAEEEAELEEEEERSERRERRRRERRSALLAAARRVAIPCGDPTCREGPSRVVRARTSLDMCPICLDEGDTKGSSGIPARNLVCVGECGQ